MSSPLSPPTSSGFVNFSLNFHYFLPLYFDLILIGGFPGGSAVKNQSANAGDTRETGPILGSGRSPEEGNGNLLQYSCLDRAWQVTVCKVARVGHDFETKQQQQKFNRCTPCCAAIKKL